MIKWLLLLLPFTASAQITSKQLKDVYKTESIVLSPKDSLYTLYGFTIGLYSLGDAAWDRYKREKEAKERAEFFKRNTPLDESIGVPTPITGPDITSYTSAQTGVGNAEVYMPTGATHVVVFAHGNGEVGTNKELLYANGSPIKRVRDGFRPNYGIIAIQFTAYNSGTYLQAVKYINWIFKTFPVKTWSATGLSYGAGLWYDYIKKATDYKAPYSAVLMSITNESQCADKTKLCGTDTRFKDIRLWALDGRNDSHHDKQKRYTDAMVKAGYPAKWETIPNTGHCCWDVQYRRDDIMSWLAGPFVDDPPLTISAGPDTLIYFPQDSYPIRVTGVPVGADVRAYIMNGPGQIEGMILKNIYKSSTHVRVVVNYNGREYLDDVTISAGWDPNAVIARFKVANLNMVVTAEGKVMQEF